MSDSGPYSDDYDPLDGIAIVGMSGRFPDSPTVAALWQNLLAGRECITRFAPDELEPGDREDMLVRSDPNYVRARGVLSGADEFDEQFFGFTPREAEILDPQQRLFMQSAWEALENAGHDPQRFDGPIGVFAGATTNSYYLQNLLSRSDVTDPLGPMTVLMSNANDYIATRVSYKFDLQGPALNIQNACSTSLVAVCLAVQSLQTYQCDMALAGAVSVRLPQRRGYLHEEGLILAPDGHCRAFDADAAGTVSSNGLGIVVLRRLRDALADGNTIYAVIKGAALNNDGSAKVGFTAPSVDGHAQVISMAQMLGGIDPATISYIEAHGTGTALGDPIEIAGLTQAFRAGGADGNGFCAIGSIKSNIGHLDVAAGVAGLIKTALALHHRTLPASINYASPNPKLDIENTPFFVNAAQRDWPAGPTPRRAGVSSFGLGGTNAHVVLEEAPLPAPAGAAGCGEWPEWRAFVRKHVERHGIDCGLVRAGVIRGAATELGENRILAGMHSPLDVMSGRMIGIAAAAANLADPANATLKAAAKHDVPEQLVTAVSDAAQVLEKLVGELLARGQRGDTEGMLAHSADFLDLMGTFVVAWQWLALYVVAQRSTQGGAAQNATRDEALRCTAQYFINTELPRVALLAALCRNAEDSYVKMRPEWFA